MRRDITTKRGLTLIELLIWAVLGLVVIGVVAGFFSKVLFYTRRGLQRGDAHGNAVMVLGKVVRDLQTSNAAGLTWSDTSPSDFSLSFHTQEGASDEHVPTFAKHLVVYSWRQSESQVLRRQTGPSEVSLDPLVPFRPDAALLVTLASAPRDTWSLVGNGVSLFKVANIDETLPPGAVGGIIKLSITTRVERPEREFQLQRTMVLRHSL